MRRRVLVAMSGGLDSSVAAWLLKRNGDDVTGIFMRNGIHADASNPRSCCSIRDAYDARRVADALGIPFYAVNFREGFEAIIDEFVAEYNAGRTPNPCVRCNRDLKFGLLLEYADSLGIDCIATGHYARIERRGRRWALLRPADREKDQTYMLYPLSQVQLSRTVFPLAGYTKPQVRQLARKAGLRTAGKPESQEICFVPGNDYRVLLRERSPESVRPGLFRTIDGRVVGTHPGHQNFTIGQRKGLGVALGRRMYVVDIEPETNTVVLGDRKDLARHTMVVGMVNWVSIDPPAAPLRARVRIRHGHAPAPATIRPRGPDEVDVTFDLPQTIIAPGQSAVFYDGDLVLGGGRIRGTR